MRREYSLEKTLTLRKCEGKRIRGWLDNVIDATNMNLTKLWEEVEDRRAVMSSAKEDLEPEGLITAEENAGQLESHTTESPPDSPPPLARVRDKLQQRLTT